MAYAERVYGGKLSKLMQIAARLAKEAPVTGNREDYLLLNYFGLNNLGLGERVLDVCGGLSRITEALAIRGVDSIAVDVGYGDIDRLAKRAKDRKVDPAFLAFAKQNPRRFIQAFAHSLLFADGTFDRIVSFYGIFGVIDDDRYLTELSVNEAIRVAKVGADLQIAPFMSGTISQNQMLTQAHCLDYLRERGDVSVFVDFTPEYPLVSRYGEPPLAKLVVTKLA